MRTVIPGIPHHATRRGNGRAQTSYNDLDYGLYRDLLARQCQAEQVSVRAWVLMPNHVHLSLTPQDSGGITRALSRVHRLYAGRIHARLERTGRFRQGRFGCVAMDEAHLGAAFRYVALNPVRARLADRATDWRWSSVHAQLGLVGDDRLTDTGPGPRPLPRDPLAAGEDEVLFPALRRAESIGRPQSKTRLNGIAIGDLSTWCLCSTCIGVFALPV